MKVEYVDHMGDDLTVVNAARVSFDKESAYDEDRFGHWSLPRKDQDLIAYLAKHGHWSPFAHPQVTFRIKAPIFVARQLQKHQVGLAWNEVSRRYVDSEPEFYTPEVWRKRAENVKQGSSNEEVLYVELQKYDTPYSIKLNVLDEGDDLNFYVGEVSSEYEALVTWCHHVYRQFINEGVCPEQARMVLPQSMYTEWYWTGSLYAFSRVCKLRLDPHAQRETQEVAKQIAEVMADLFPVSWKALMA